MRGRATAYHGDVLVRLLIGLLASALVLGSRRCKAGEEAPARPELAENALYAEIGGTAVLGSVSYEWRFADSGSARVGVGVVPRSCDNAACPAIFWPLMLCGLAGSGDHRLEASIGPVFAVNDEEPVYGSAALGYRYHPLEGGLLFRAAFTPVFGVEGRDREFFFFPWAGVSVGVAF